MVRLAQSGLLLLLLLSSLRLNDEHELALQHLYCHARMLIFLEQHLFGYIHPPVFL